MSTDLVPLHIHQALVDIAIELGKVGISKDRRNEQQGYAFRGIDDLMNVAGPIIAKHGVVMLPSYSDYHETERVTGKGATLIYARVTGTFTFIAAKDGSSVTVTTIGTGMDSGDKAGNKAMSGALKYALMQLLLVPTEGTEDADATTPEPSIPKPAAGFEEWFVGVIAESEHGFEAIREIWKESPEAFRNYAMQYRNPEWTAAKKRAGDVTAAAKAPAAERPAAPDPLPRTITRPEPQPVYKGDPPGDEAKPLSRRALK